MPFQPPNPESEDSAIPAWTERGYDVTYLPRVGHTTGHLDVHDMAIDANGRLIFVNTMFGCLATLSDRASRRSHQMVKQQVALRLDRPIKMSTAQDQMNGDSRFDTGRDRLPAVIALHAGAPHKVVGSFGQSGTEQKLVMPRLVSSESQPGAVVSFDPDRRAAQLS